MDIQYLERDGKPQLAYMFTPPRDAGSDLPIVMFCGGFRSDMMGTKATHFEKLCQTRGQGYLRFDYSGHGMSGGDFKDGTIGAWFEDACDIFDALIDAPVVIVGSSMGGWVSLLMAEARAAHVKGLIGIASAPDFTVRLFDEELSDAQRTAVLEAGFVEIPNDYSDDPYIFTAKLFEDGRENLVLNQDYSHNYPISLFHGLKDATVPRDVPQAIKACYSGGPLDIVYIEDGDHSLSRTEDLEMIAAEIVAMSNDVRENQI